MKIPKIYTFFPFPYRPPFFFFFASKGFFVYLTHMNVQKKKKNTHSLYQPQPNRLFDQRLFTIQHSYAGLNKIKKIKIISVHAQKYTVLYTIENYSQLHVYVAITITHACTPFRVCSSFHPSKPCIIHREEQLIFNGTHFNKWSSEIFIILFFTPNQRLVYRGPPSFDTVICLILTTYIVSSSIRIAVTVLYNFVKT